ncbi:DNA adenine methylase [Chitinophaga sp.]|uniref:DNA adenine methylase n=1 Tax=Chitinophaga sp. TaxID=1869181 RepID=UPI0031DA468C
MTNKEIETDLLNDQFRLFPGTRYMGSKNKIIQEIGEILLQYKFDSIYDAFAGSNVVGYFFKSLGKEVITNDFMALSYTLSKAIIENHKETLSSADIDLLLNNPSNQTFIAEKFQGLYFEDRDNQFLDKVRNNIPCLTSEYKQALALSALTRSCMKKRPRGIFTFTGHRYDDGRQDMLLTLEEHFILNVDLFNRAVFDNQKSCRSHNVQTENLNVKADLVYLDPPYFTPNSDNDYVRRYHFVEGLVKNWQGIDIQEHTKTKKFKSYYSPFSKRSGAYNAFEKLIEKFKNSVIAISYSSNSQPGKNELLKMLAEAKENVVVHEIDHVYSFGNQNHKIGNTANRVKEYLFVGF